MTCGKPAITFFLAHKRDAEVEGTMQFKASHDNDSELRRMSRAELVDIIYSLKVSETNLQQQVTDLQQQLVQQKQQLAQSATMDSLAAQMSLAIKEMQSATAAARIAASECRSAVEEVHGAAEPLSHGKHSQGGGSL